MEDTFNSAAVAGAWRVGRRLVAPLSVVYPDWYFGAWPGSRCTGIVTIAQGWQHAIELFGQDAWLVIPIMLGFGMQAGLYTYLRKMLRRGSRRSKMMMGAGGGTSTAAMVACCAHHVADLLPLLGLSAAASFLAAYKLPFMLIGLAMNVLGIVVIWRAIRKEQRYLDRLKSTPLESN
jgi:hypothetical protein